MSAATISSIKPTDRRERKPQPTATVPPSDQTTEQPTAPTAPTEQPTAGQGQTQPGQMDAPTVPSNSGTLDAEAQARADALKAATDRAVTARERLPLALAMIDASETEKRDAFVDVFTYFDGDKGFAWRNLDGLPRWTRP